MASGKNRAPEGQRRPSVTEDRRAPPRRAALESHKVRRGVSGRESTPRSSRRPSACADAGGSRSAQQVHLRLDAVIAQPGRCANRPGTRSGPISAARPDPAGRALSASRFHHAWSVGPVFERGDGNLSACSFTESDQGGDSMHPNRNDFSTRASYQRRSSIRPPARPPPLTDGRRASPLRRHRRSSWPARAGAVALLRLHRRRVARALRWHERGAAAGAAAVRLAPR